MAEPELEARSLKHQVHGSQSSSTEAGHHDRRVYKRKWRGQAYQFKLTRVDLSEQVKTVTRYKTNNVSSSENDRDSFLSLKQDAEKLSNYIAFKALTVPNIGITPFISKFSKYCKSSMIFTLLVWFQFYRWGNWGTRWNKKLAQSYTEKQEWKVAYDLHVNHGIMEAWNVRVHINYLVPPSVWKLRCRKF